MTSHEHGSSKAILQLRLLGLVMFLGGGVLLGLLFTPWKNWALNHSIASFAGATDRRAGNTVDGPVDMTMSIVGDGVMMFAGLWVGLLVPRLLNTFRRGRSGSHDTAAASGLSAPSALRANGSATKSFGHAAFDPADVEDARRGHPAVSLQPFAAATGLEYAGPAIEAGFLSTLPAWSEYNFNVCRGEFPVGRLGRLGHELREMSASEGSIRDGGTFYDVRVTTHRSARDMFNLGDGDPQHAPFAGDAVWIPTTTIHLRIPEVNQLPVLTISRTGEVVFGGSKLDRFGLSGYRLKRGPKNDDALLAAVGAACGPALASRSDAFVELRIKYGTVALTVNGYRHHEHDLRSLIWAASNAAEGLAAIIGPTTDAQLGLPGPRVGTQPIPEGVLRPTSDFAAAYERAADEWSMVNEDPLVLSARLPRCPIPGVASGVLFGNVPGLGTLARLVWFEDGSKMSGTVRGGVIVPAAPGAATPLGGLTHAPTGMQVEVVDGVAYCWKLECFVRRLEKLQLGPDSKAAFAATGVPILTDDASAVQLGIS